MDSLPNIELPEFIKNAALLGLSAYVAKQLWNKYKEDSIFSKYGGSSPTKDKIDDIITSPWLFRKGENKK